MIRRAVGSTFWLSGIIVLGFLAPQTAFPIILSAFALSFMGYVLLSRDFGGERPGLFLVVMAILGRLLLFPSTPALSDDIYRFIWDGMLQLDGIPLLESTPTTMIENGTLNRPVYEDLYPLLNSPDYLTIYPPMIQWINAFAAFLSDGRVIPFALVIRIFMLAGDLISAGILWRIGKEKGLGSAATLWWLMNPLLVVETTGNLHAEGLVVTALLATWHYLKRNNLVGGAILFSMAVLLKLHPLMLLPLLLLNLGIGKGIKFLSAALTLIAGSFLICYGTSIFQLSDSVRLYFQHFEFNAGIYYLVRSIAEVYLGYNPIQWLGPTLATSSLIIILSISWAYRNKMDHVIMGAGWIYALYFLLSTTVHPWYILLPFGLMLISSYRISVTGWTFLVTLSYSHYWGDVNSPNWPLTIIEYVLLVVLIWINIRYQLRCRER